jgi:hypothetical protein
MSKADKKSLNLKDKNILKEFTKSGEHKSTRKDFDLLLKKASGAKE